MMVANQLICIQNTTLGSVSSVSCLSKTKCILSWTYGSAKLNSKHSLKKLHTETA